MKFSEQERNLLKAIQSDASVSLSDLATQVGMATSTIWRKLQEFEATGLIGSKVSLLDPAKADVRLCTFATVRLVDHSEDTIASFARMVKTHPEIMEAHAISGSADYILKIRCQDVEAYEVFMTKNLLRSELVKRVEFGFSLKQLKYTTALPL